MFKFVFKTLLIGGLTLGVAVAIAGPDQMMQWALTSKKAVEKKINDLQGMRSELTKIEASVRKLDREIDKLKENSLREELEIEALKKDIQSRQTSLDSLHNNLEKAEILLDADLDRFNINGITYTRREVQQDVAEKMRLYKVQNDTMAQLRQTLVTRNNAHTFSTENVTKGIAVRENLTNQVRLLEARLEKYRAREIYAEAVATDFDAREFNTVIGEARQTLAKFDRKLQVKSRMLDERIRVAGDGSAVIGINYAARSNVTISLRDELSQLLNNTPVQSSESSNKLAANQP